MMLRPAFTVVSVTILKYGDRLDTRVEKFRSVPDEDVFPAYDANAIPATF